ELCDLEGMTHERAARRLGWPVGTVSVRLLRARERLRTRLIRRGLAPSDGLSASVLAGEPASATLPAALGASTVHAALRVVAGKTMTVGAISASVTLFMEGMLWTLYWTKLGTIATTLIVAAGMLTAGAGYFAQEGTGPDQKLAQVTQAQAAPPQKENKAANVVTKVFYIGDLIMSPRSIPAEGLQKTIQK